MRTEPFLNFGTTAWCHIMAQTITWHKTEDRISIVTRLPSVKFVHFHLPNMGVQVTTDRNN